MEEEPMTWKNVISKRARNAVERFLYHSTEAEHKLFNRFITEIVKEEANRRSKNVSEKDLLVEMRMDEKAEELLAVYKKVQIYCDKFLEVPQLTYLARAILSKPVLMEATQQVSIAISPYLKRIAAPTTYQDSYIPSGLTPRPPEPMLPLSLSSIDPWTNRGKRYNPAEQFLEYTRKTNKTRKPVNVNSQQLWLEKFKKRNARKAPFAVAESNERLESTTQGMYLYWKPEPKIASAQEMLERFQSSASIGNVIGNKKQFSEAGALNKSLDSALPKVESKNKGTGRRPNSSSGSPIKGADYYATLRKRLAERQQKEAEMERQKPARAQTSYASNFRRPPSASMKQIPKPIIPVHSTPFGTWHVQEQFHTENRRQFTEDHSVKKRHVV